MQLWDLFDRALAPRTTMASSTITLVNCKLLKLNIYPVQDETLARVLFGEIATKENISAE